MDYITTKAREMRNLEEQVRLEVELLWEKYRDGPGREHSERRMSSLSQLVELHRPTSKETAFSPTVPAINPILAEAATSPAYPAGSSLLSASISANTFYSAQPPAVTSRVDISIDEISKATGVQSSAREQAMSFVFSSLDEAMAPRRKNNKGSTMTQDLAGKDSWIDAERRILSDRVAKLEVADGESQQTTPKPRISNLRAETIGEGHEKKVVKFEEPEASHEADLSQPELDRQIDDIDCDGMSHALMLISLSAADSEYVFDFELDDSPQPTGPNRPRLSPPVATPPVVRSRNMVEASLSSTFAADAPSHRAAWRRIEQTGSIYAPLRKGTADSGGAESSEESVISKLGASMPMGIALKGKARPPVPMERKTSLSEREAVLVPSLMGVMRENGMIHGNSLALDVPTPRGRSPSRPTKPDSGLRKSARSESISRERESVVNYAADPGAVFETLVDAEEEDEGSQVDGQAMGSTLRGNRTFVPPHLVAIR